MPASICFRLNEPFILKGLKGYKVVYDLIDFNPFLFIEKYSKTS